MRPRAARSIPTRFWSRRFFGVLATVLTAPLGTPSGLAQTAPAAPVAPAAPAAEPDGLQVLTLDDALALAMKNNRDLQAARVRLRGSYADVERAMSALLPLVTAQGKLT